MTYLLNKSQKDIQKAASDFAKGEFDKELAMEMDRNRTFPQELHQKASELGFIGIHFDEAYLGGGLSFLENVLMAETLCRKDATMGGALMLAGYGAECLLRSGSRELKEAFIPPVAEGKMLASAAIPDTIQVNGSNPVSLTAEKTGDSWVIYGRVNHVINGGAAGFCCALCRTDTGASSDKGLSMILVEGDRDGMSVADCVETFGMRMTAVADLHFDNVRVPLSNLIGKEGQGLKQLLAFTSASRVLMAGLALGIGQGALDRTINYVKQREQFGKKIGRFQVTAHKLADMALSMEQARSLTYQAAWQLNQKKPDPRLTSMAKLAATRAALTVAHEAIQLHGGYGYTTEYEVERFCRDAKFLEIMGGTTGPLKDDIAAAIIRNIK